MSRSVLLFVLVSVLGLACVSGLPHRKLDAMRFQSVDAQAICPGNCKSRASCNSESTILTGKCPGPADIICCVPPHAPTPAPAPAPKPAPARPVTPAAASGPTSSGCANIGGTCTAGCANGFATSGLCSGTNICCAPFSADPFTRIGQIATSASNTCVQHTFTSQSHKKPSVAGKAPKSFLKGVALTYAKAVCQPARADVEFVGRAALTGTDDILSQYRSIFAAKGLSNAASGLPIVRHLYSLLIGLGMCESGGSPCTGRDMSSNFATADSAESGLFQTSWGAHRFSKLLDDLYAKYSASTKGCFKNEFYGTMTCSATNWKNWPEGQDSATGFKWQKLTKECPAFAVEFASVLLRVHGGPVGEWMPLRRQYAEVRPECDSMLQQVEAVVQANPAVCTRLLA